MGHPWFPGFLVSWFPCRLSKLVASHSPSAVHSSAVRSGLTRVAHRSTDGALRNKLIPSRPPSQLPLARRTISTISVATPSAAISESSRPLQNTCGPVILSAKPSSSGCSGG